ncbi:hypothetical protein ABI59_22285 [Acidobacteria bacterium Mor1]|nr:hypothetical protein ABI59_22285 [Acidobacteria bacterium Mor1]
MRTLISFSILSFALLLSAPAAAQQSAGFTLEEHSFNQGGRPGDGVTAASTNYRISLDAIGGFSARPLAGATYGINGGFVAPYLPAEEVRGLRFSTRDMLVWDVALSAAGYRLYRDDLAALSGLGYGDCLDTAAQSGYLDLEQPQSARGFFYLVTTRDRLDHEGTKGFDAAGSERANPAPCP